MRKPFIAGNWKMNLLTKDALALASALVDELNGVSGMEIAIAPVYTVLSAVNEVVRGTNIGLAGQDVYWVDSGAYTGAIGPAMLKDAGCGYAIIGHSERRQYFNETDITVNNKVKAAIGADLTPILCVGETLAEREAEKTFAVVRRQAEEGMRGIPRADAANIVVAYEPVWAIGTGKTASPEQAQEVHGFIRKTLSEMYDQDFAETVRLQYGGSVKADNIERLMSEPDIDGALVGGASLKADSFIGLIKNGLKARS
jgi:triosephosphate isomerase (TIM)